MWAFFPKNQSHFTCQINYIDLQFFIIPHFGLNIVFWQRWKNLCNEHFKSKIETVSGHMLEGTMGLRLQQQKTYGSVKFDKYIKLFMKMFIFTKIIAMQAIFI